MARMTQIQNRLDAYLNTITGLGTTRDKSSYTVPGCAPRLRYQELSEMYEGDPIVARVVDRVVDDATRPGWQLTTDDQEFDHAQLMGILHRQRPYPHRVEETEEGCIQTDTQRQ